MKKQKKQLIILLAICAVCVIAFVVFKILDLSEETQEDDSFAITDFETEDVTAFVAAGDYPLDFYKEEDTWYQTEDQKEADTEAVEDLLSSLNQVMSDVEIPDPEDLSLYGLDEPWATISITLSDDSVVTLSFGDYNDTNYEYYAMLDGSDSVYMVTYAVATSLMTTPDELLLESDDDEEDTGDSEEEEADAEDAEDSGDSEDSEEEETESAEDEESDTDDASDETAEEDEDSEASAETEAESEEESDEGDAQDEASEDDEE